MKTIDERAYEYACKNDKPSTFFCDLEKSYKVGADEQREEDLEVFCQWLTDFANTIYWEVESPSSSKPIGEIFREQIKMRLGIFEEE